MNTAERHQFLVDYRTIRHAEGRGSADSAYYQALPYHDLTGRNSWQWGIRARTYRHFERRILTAIEAEQRRPLDLLDLGAGNGWMSYRLALRGHRPLAIDIFNDGLDGLGAVSHYPVRFPAVEAEFDRLPVPSGAFDLAIFNASIHYSTDYRATLSEARRCLRPAGRVVILDSPVYRCHQHGIQMRQERHAQFERQYGFRSDALPSIEFFDEETLRDLSRDLGIAWERSQPWYGWNWALRPWKAKLQGRRPPSRFLILVGRFSSR